MARSLEVIHNDMDQAQEKYFATIVQHYGRKDADEICQMIRMGSDGYCAEVLDAHNECVNLMGDLWNEHYIAKGIGVDICSD